MSYWQCTCGNIWRDKIDLRSRKKHHPACPLHPERRAREITKQDRREAIKGYGLAVGSVANRNHGYYRAGMVGGKVLCPNIKNQ
jgi:hypothetical protein